MLRLGDLLERPAIIREQQKRVSEFKITPIGGPKELAEWKKKQAVKMANYHAERKKIKEHKKQLIAGADAPEGELTWEGKVILAESLTWDEKLTEAKIRRRLLKPKKLAQIEIPEEQNGIQKQPSKIQELASWAKAKFKKLTS